MTGADLFEVDIRERIERELAEIADFEATALPIDAAPHLGAARQLAADSRLRDAHRHQIAVSQRMTGKNLARRAAAQTALADAKRCLAKIEADGAAASDRASRKGSLRRDHELAGVFADGADWLRGRITGAAPGAIVAWREEHGVERVTPVPLCEEQLAACEADVTESMGQLIAALDAWDRHRAKRRAELREAEQPVVAEAS